MYEDVKQGAHLTLVFIIGVPNLHAFFLSIITLECGRNIADNVNGPGFI